MNYWIMNAYICIYKNVYMCGFILHGEKMFLRISFMLFRNLKFIPSRRIFRLES